MSIARRAILVAVFGCATVLTEGAAQWSRSSSDDPWIPSSRLARAASLGHPTLLANAYWLRAVQCTGSADRDADKLYSIAELVTDLDPDHWYAYHVAGVILASAGRIKESNRILEKGIAASPEHYTLALTRGMNSLMYDGDYVAAAHFMEIAARAPGAPSRLSQNVLAMFVKGRQADAAIEFLEQMHAESKDADTRAALERQIAQARLEQVAAPLDDAIRAYHAAFGFSPATVEQLVGAGLVAEVPRDPFGGSLVIEKDGRVHSTANDFRFSPARVPSPEAEPGVNPGRDYRKAQ